MLGRPFSDLKEETGLLWLINSVVFHPRGVAFALYSDNDGNITGWNLVNDGTDEPWHYNDSPTINERYRAANRTIAEAGGH